MNPFVSVLMTAFNRSEYINEAIESVLSQTFNDYELIIVDDNSSDDTFLKAQKFAASEPRIKLFRNDFNLGQFDNRNKAASLASGEFIMYVDSDDFINNDTLFYLNTIFQQFPEASFATISHDKTIFIPCIMQPQEIINRHFFEKSTLHIGPGGTMIRRSLFQRIGGFPVKYGPVGDMYYNINAALNSATILMPYNYLNYRRHNHQEINDRFSYLFNGYRYFNDVSALPNLPMKQNDVDILLRKNKRRFLVNTLKYYFKTLNLRKSLLAIKLADYKIKDFLIAIFQV
jgi:glycosyltransferase involved in cell wall biosynthesis